MAIKQDLKQVANAIRSKTGKNNLMTVSEMPAEIESIETGIEPTGTLDIAANANNIDVAQYAAVNVNVPGQTPTGTKYIYNNGTHDVTNYATAEVNVASSLEITIVGPYTGAMDSLLRQNELNPDDFIPRIGVSSGSQLTITIDPEQSLSSEFDYSDAGTFNIPSSWNDTGNRCCYFKDYSIDNNPGVRLPIIVPDANQLDIRINIASESIRIELTQTEKTSEEVQEEFGTSLNIYDAEGTYLGDVSTSDIEFIASSEC